MSRAPRAMNKNQLRMVQLACILWAVSAGLLLPHLRRPGSDNRLGLIHWISILAALYSAVSGFTTQRWLANRPMRIQSAKRGSTPATRWTAGHLLRLVTAAAVAGWGDVLSSSGAPLWTAYAVYGLGIVLLLVWSPGTPPPEELPKTV